MTKYIFTILINLMFLPSAQAYISAQDFTEKYPVKCFEVSEPSKTKNKSSFCRMSRLKFYQEYLSRQATAQKGSIEKLYTMIRTREALNNQW